jgi:hypothetical protein
MSVLVRSSRHFMQGSGAFLEQYRARFWPGVRVPEPGTRPLRTRERREGAFVVPRNRTGAVSESDPLHEVYLELAELDLGSRPLVDSFVQRYGILGVSEGRFPRHLWDEDLAEPAFEFVGLRWDRSAELSKVLFNELRARYRALDVDRYDPGPGIETLIEFEHGATLIKDMLNAWRWVSSENRRPEPWRSLLWQHADLARPASRLEALEFLRAHLNEGLAEAYHDFGLSYFNPHLDLPPDASGRKSIPPDQPRLYALCCLQLFNHMVEGATYRRCQNDRCGRLFVRQFGRAEQGQHRTKGKLMFHTRKCANAAGERQRYRDRKAADYRGPS